MVIVQLAALGAVACGREEPPQAPAVEPVTVTPVATMPIAVDPSTGPDVEPSATASPPTAPTGNPKLGAQCNNDADCGAGLFCQRNFTGAGFLPGGNCVNHHPIYEGRPLVVDGVAAVAPSRRSAAWHRNDDGARGAAAAAMGVEERASWAAHLATAALEEHASVGAFARTICELLALGAPLWLVEATQRALADEVRHAELSFAWASALAGAPSAPGALQAATAPFACSADERGASLVRDVFRGGCVGEALAAERALVRSEEAPLALRPVFAKIAEDEAAHAALALRTAEWLAREIPSAASALAEEIARFEATATTTERAIVAPLLEASGLARFA